MTKVLSKQVLDEELLKELVKYYKINTSSEEWDDEKYLEWECFSHPNLQLHDCNYRSRLLGGHTCEYCNHSAERPCKYSCDFQHFCLAVFAWRLGIGGAEVKEAIKHNLYVLRKEELYSEVIKKLSMEEMEYAECLEELKEEDIESVVDHEEEEVDDLLTVKEAAEYFGCTYSNIHNYITGGKLPYVIDSGKKRVSRAALDVFREERQRG